MPSCPYSAISKYITKNLVEQNKKRKSAVQGLLVRTRAVATSFCCILSPAEKAACKYFKNLDLLGTPVYLWTRLGITIPKSSRNAHCLDSSPLQQCRHRWSLLSCLNQNSRNQLLSWLCLSTQHQKLHQDETTQDKFMHLVALDATQPSHDDRLIG